MHRGCIGDAWGCKGDARRYERMQGDTRGCKGMAQEGARAMLALCVSS